MKEDGLRDQIADASADTFATRKSVLEPETIWRLTPDALVRERLEGPPKSIWAKIIETVWRILFPWGESLGGDKWPDTVPYDQIASIRVRFDPTRVDRVRERCDLVHANGARVSLFSTRYVGFANFEDQAAVYKPFINELTRRTLAVRPQTSIHSGLTWPSYIVQHGFLLAALLALVSILGVAGFPALGTIWAKIIIALSYVGVLWAYARRNVPRKLNPPPE
jgi:hypothetical protein